MIYFTSGNMFDDGFLALVNPVNCVGSMGKGLALHFRERFPINYKAYKACCDMECLHIGEMLVVDDGDVTIINFPTKLHWRDPSEYQYIADGVIDLHAVINEYQFKSVAIPALGCGLGGLDWDIVRNMLVDTLGDLECDVVIYEPK